jgi:hypothetical protein
MTLEELRAAYEEANRHFSDLVPSTTEQIAHKLIAALEQRVQEVERERDAKLQQAEQALAAAREEIERMKVCGNCGHMMTHELWYQCGTVPDVGEAYEVPCAPPLNCHFAPSRWTPTPEAPE